MSSTVIISGGGPAGLMLACELALAGTRAVVLDQRTEQPDVSAGMAIHGRTLAVLRQRGLADRIGPGDMFPWPLTPFALLWLDMTGAADQDYTHAFPQWRLERLLAERAIELGVDIRRGHSLTGLDQSESGVTAEVTVSGDAYRMPGAYLVGCDGAESRVRELAGIGFSQIAGGYDGMLGDMERGDGADEAFDAGLHSGGMFGAIPLSSEVMRLMTIEFGRQGPAGDTPVTAAELRQRIHRVTGAEPRLGRFRWLCRFGAPTRLAQRYRAGRVFLAGDAAHSLFISGTQGVNASIHDALNLGWKLAAVLNHQAPPELLDTYHEERWPAGQRACWHAGASIALLHPPAVVTPLRELIGELIAFKDVNRHLLEVTTRVRYPPANGPSAHPLEGTFLSDAPVLETHPAGLATASRAGRGVLLDLSDGAADLSAITGWAERVDVVPAKPAPDTSAAALLIRPDGVIAHAARTASDLSGLRAALTSWFGPERL
jgi:2-polyprenyl-6-methoxyphenol hydroxylase-like FAD-dependent oxidoreductase